MLVHTRKLRGHDQRWMPAIPDVRAMLEGGVEVADIGCGSGRALIKLAQAFRTAGTRSTTRAAIIAGEYHLTVFPAAFGRGLRWMIDQMRG